MTANVTTTTTAGFQNASMGMTNGFGSTGDLFPVFVLVVYAVAVLAVANFAAPGLARSRVASRLGAGVVAFFGYVLKGVVASAVLTVAALPVYYVATMDPSGRGIALEVVGYGVAGLAALAVVGWLADRAVARFIDAHPDYDSWEDLWGSADEPDDPDLGEPEVAD